MSARYYVLAPNEHYPTPTLWRKGDVDPDFPTHIGQRPSGEYPGDWRRQQWFDDVVAGLRATGPAVQRWAAILGRPAPHPTGTGPKGGQRLSPVLTEWMMGWPDGWTDIPGLTRSQRLSLCGDGVVPQQAAAALQHLHAVHTELGVAS